MNLPVTFSCTTTSIVTCPIVVFRTFTVVIVGILNTLNVLFSLVALILSFRIYEAFKMYVPLFRNTGSIRYIAVESSGHVMFVPLLSVMFTLPSVTLRP